MTFVKALTRDHGYNLDLLTRDTDFDLASKFGDSTTTLACETLIVHQQHHVPLFLNTHFGKNAQVFEKIFYLSS